MAKPPVKRKLKDFFAPRDATETERQGQGIGDIEAMRQMLTVPAAAARTAVQDAGTQQREAFGRMLSGAATQDDMTDMASDFMLPMAGTIGKVAKNMVPTSRALAKQAAQEAERVANADKYFPIEDLFHSTTVTKPFQAFEPRGGGQWHDIYGTHVGTVKAAEDRSKQIFGDDFEPIMDQVWKKGGKREEEVGMAASIMPLRMRMENPLYNKQGKPFTEEELQDAVKNFGYESGMLKRPDQSSASWMSREQRPTLSQMRDVQQAYGEQLRAAGHDVIPYINEHEDIGSLSYLVLDPTRLRSKFAKFDPKKLNSANLSAGLGSLFVGGAMAKAASRDNPND